MRALTRPLRPFLGLLLACVAGLALAQAKPRIEKAADLPRFSYKIDGKVEDVVRSAEKFAPFAAALRRDTESVLAGYEIADKATRRDLLNIVLTLDYLDGRTTPRWPRIEEMRALQDKPADKLLTGQRLKAMIQAGRSAGSGDDYRRAVGEAIQRDLAALPYAVIENDIKGAKANAELIGETLILGRVREVLQPVVDEKGELSSDLAPGIVFARFSLIATSAAEADPDLDLRQLPGRPPGRQGRHLGGARRRPPARRRACAGRDRGLGQRHRHPLFAEQMVREAGQPAVIAFDKLQPARDRRARAAAAFAARQGRADRRRAPRAFPTCARTSTARKPARSRSCSRACRRISSAAPRKSCVSAATTSTAPTSPASPWRATRARGWWWRGSTSATRSSPIPARAASWSSAKPWRRRPTSTS